MPSVDTESVLRFIRARGPSLPVHVAKEIKQNSMMAGAVLSELVSSGKLKISKIKVGGSPLYYPPGQENRLMSFTQHLDSKDRQAYELLRQKGLLRDEFLDPLTRVSLRSLKDFAIPLTVNIDGTKQVYWKWYLHSDQSTEELIKDMLGIAKQTPEPSIPAEKLNTLPSPEIPRGQPELHKEHGLISAQISGSEYEEDEEHPTEIKIEAPHVHDTISLHPTKLENYTSEQIQPRQPRPTPKKVKLEGQTQLDPEAISDHPKKSEADFSSDPFYTKLESFLSQKSIRISTITCIKKSTDFECIVAIPSPFGPLTYFCKAINKKRVQEADVTQAYLHSQFAHLPGILVSPGKLTKQAHQLIETKLKGLIVSTM